MIGSLFVRVKIAKLLPVPRPRSETRSPGGPPKAGAGNPAQPVLLVREGDTSGRRKERDLLAQPEIETMEEKRDRAILAVLLGCALRRSELAALNCGHIQQRDGRWVFVDLVGKGKRIRTVPIPPFVKVAIDAWTAAGLSKGPCFGGCVAVNIRKRRLRR
jgi:integrase